MVSERIVVRVPCMVGDNRVSLPMMNWVSGLTVTDTLLQNLTYLLNEAFISVYT